MEFGTKYRLTPKFIINSILKEFTYDIYLFMYKISFSCKKPNAYFNQQKILVIDKLTDDLKANASDPVKIKTHFPINY